MTTDAVAAVKLSTVGDAAAEVRHAISVAATRPGEYGAPRNLGSAPERTRAALDALAAEAARPDPDVRQLGKHMQAVGEAASWMGSGLAYDPDVTAAADKLRRAVIEDQTGIAMKGLNPAARHVTITSEDGRQGHYDIRDPATLRSCAQQAALRGWAVQEASGPPEISGLPKSLQALYSHAEANWNVSLRTGARSDGSPIQTVTATHPGRNLSAEQTYHGGKRFTYNAEPVKAGMARIAENPRGEYTAPDREAEAG